jgi:sugar phosphate isomerase/epimerase
VELSVATANYYYIPFEQALEVIAESGFVSIELDLYWEYDRWAMAQHLKNFKTKDVLRAVHSAGLIVTSIHDGGGVLLGPDSTNGFINYQLNEYVDQLGYTPKCIVLHTPHIKGTYDKDWWNKISEQIIVEAESYIKNGTAVTIENVPLLDGYFVPVVLPNEMNDFLADSRIYFTFDTSHFAYSGIDIIQASKVLQNRIKTIHLSDYKNGQSHVLIGDGDLCLNELIQNADLKELEIITIECSTGYFGEDVTRLTKKEMVIRMMEVKKRISCAFCQDNSLRIIK